MSVWAAGFEPRYDAAGKRCGRSYIPANAVCNNGQKRRVARQVLEKTAQLGGMAIGLRGTYLGYKAALTGDRKTALRSISFAQAGNAIGGLGLYAEGKRTGDKLLQRRARNITLTGATLSGASYLASGGRIPRLPRLTTAENDIRRRIPSPGRVMSRLRTRVAGIGYRRRSGPPRQVGYLPTRTAQPFDPRGRGNRGSWSKRGS